LGIKPTCQSVAASAHRETAELAVAIRAVLHRHSEIGEPPTATPEAAPVRMDVDAAGVGGTQI
jgi:hypothetical protein